MASMNAGTEVPAGGQKAVFPPFDATTFPSQLIWLAIFFVILYTLVSRLVVPRVGGTLDARAAKIEGDLARASKLKAEAEALVVSRESALSAARNSARALADETKAQANREIDATRHDLEGKLATRIEQSEATIVESRTKALSNVGKIASELTEAMVAQLVGMNVDADAVKKALKKAGAAS
jgi:F-type H+-transporting ATPase subunit b